LNDEINKLIREKGHWERRIVELGGPDYAKAGPKVTDSKGQEVAELTGKWWWQWWCWRLPGGGLRSVERCRGGRGGGSQRSLSGSGVIHMNQRAQAGRTPDNVHLSLVCVAWRHSHTCFKLCSPYVAFLCRQGHRLPLLWSRQVAARRKGAV
jgi:hypothetical protein